MVSKKHGGTVAHRSSSGSQGLEGLDGANLLRKDDAEHEVRGSVDEEEGRVLAVGDGEEASPRVKRWQKGPVGACLRGVRGAVGVCSPRAWAFAMLMFGIVVLVVITAVLYMQYLRNAQDDFKRSCSKEYESVKSRFEADWRAVAVFEGLVVSVVNISEKEFRDFAVVTQSTRPTTSVMYWLRRVTDIQRPSFEAQYGNITTRSARGFTRSPPHDEYAVVAFLEPNGEAVTQGFTNARVFINYNFMELEGYTKEVVETARDTGQPAHTPASFIYGSEKFFRFVPVYNPGSDISTKEGRRANCIGYLTAMIDVEGAMKNLTESDEFNYGNPVDVSICMYDATLRKAVEAGQGGPLGPTLAGNNSATVFKAGGGVCFDSGHRAITIKWEAGLREYDIVCFNSENTLWVSARKTAVWSAFMLAIVLLIVGSLMAISRHLAKMRAHLLHVKALNRDLESARAAADAANQAKTVFLTGVSHEFRTPVSAVVGIMDILLADEGAMSNASPKHLDESPQHSGDSGGGGPPVPSTASPTYRPPRPLQSSGSSGNLSSRLKVINTTSSPVEIATVPFSRTWSGDRGGLGTPGKQERVELLRVARGNAMRLVELVGSVVEFADKFKRRNIKVGLSRRRRDLPWSVMADTKDLKEYFDNYAAEISPPGSPLRERSVICSDGRTLVVGSSRGTSPERVKVIEDSGGEPDEAAMRAPAGGTSEASTSTVQAQSLELVPTGAGPTADGQGRRQDPGQAASRSPEVVAKPEAVRDRSEDSGLEITEVGGGRSTARGVAAMAAGALGGMVAASAAAAGRSSGVRQDHHQGPPLTVLCVDDVAINVKLAARMLSQMGCLVKVALSGEEALHQVYPNGDNQAEHIDLILMDLRMPGMDGLQTTRELRRRGFRNVIAALTADVLECASEQCFHAGMTYFYQKPLQRKVLEGLVQEVKNKLTEEAGSGSGWSERSEIADPG